MLPTLDAMRTTALAAAALASVARAMQPDAVPPLPAPMRPLPWGEINFLHTTDTHGWHGGHLQESQYSADWGDYVSFADHMRRRADADGVDLLLVDTGDRVEGNGLYDASAPKGRYTSAIYREQAVDLLCSGNHELYQAATTDRERRVTVPSFGGHYLASNLDYVDPATGARGPLAAQRYRAFTTPNQKIRVVAFGFLFNFTGNAANSVVQPVQETVREPWFQHAVRREPADLFVVIGHVGARMPELRVVYDAIRAANPATPIAMLAGHYHIRDAVRFDDRAVAVASGRYMETLGWLSVRGLNNSGSSDSGGAQAPVVFGRRYIDNNLLGLYYHSGTDAASFPTDHGRNVTAAIAAARADLGLATRFGCAPQNYWLQRRRHDDPASIFTLLRERVLPEAVVRPDRAAVPRLVLLNTGAMRFDIFRGPFTRDTTYIVSPFVSRLHYIPDVPYALASQVLGILNSYGPILSAMVAAADEAAAVDEKAAAAASSAAVRAVDWRQLAGPEQHALRRTAAGADGHGAVLVDDDGGGDDDDSHQQKPLAEPAERADDGTAPHRPPLVAGYTTWDDFGHDGDDAVHEPLPFFRAPNCIQAAAGFPAEAEEAQQPATVDLVFLDFIEKLVLQALAYAAGKETAAAAAAAYPRYTEADIQTYLEGTFTEHFAGWVKQHWDGDC